MVGSQDCYFQGLGVGAALSLPLGRTELAVARLDVVEADRWVDAREELEAVGRWVGECGKENSHLNVRYPISAQLHSSLPPFSPSPFLSSTYPSLLPPPLLSSTYPFILPPPLLSSTYPSLLTFSSNKCLIQFGLNGIEVWKVT